ncbi:FkbM family methyltransferase [Gillisia sp. Hel_I_86]|uniref:FkbM family methyltransferase n=1 Tax=Gillisia sp. Hel_I_86 TaxID=1249981 RepID=UPI00119B97C4|nr:FkbM family methyltransferase [Gillisia sp. Hel_I_86]TVZ25584.1 FkbM family methyltransferase [Gillisia sp. Hel_I_86]
MGFSELKKFIFKITPIKILKMYQEPIKNQVRELDSFSTLSYSQEGEDLILKRIFEGQKTGFYIDVGAHHPQRFSNTYLFYKMGWRGINIDAMPGSMVKFKELRPGDINVEIAVSDKEEILTFHIFNEPALNTFDTLNADRYQLDTNYKVIAKKELKVFPLVDVLDKYNSEEKQIDFMNIDVEGLDLHVLKSNNWIKYKPLIILIELLEMKSIDEIQKSEIYIFLISKGYVFFAKTVNTCIFKVLN